MDYFSRAKRASWLYALLILVMGTAGCRTTSHSARPVPSTDVTSTTQGASLDDIDGRNRENIAAQLGRPVAPGPATPNEVVSMTRAGVDSRYIICYINRSTNLTPITADDVIFMHEQGVNEQVIQAMLTPGTAFSRAEIAREMPPRVYILQDPLWPYSHPRYGVYYGYGWGRCY